MTRNLAVGVLAAVGVAVLAAVVAWVAFSAESDEPASGSGPRSGRRPAARVGDPSGAADATGHAGDGETGEPDGAGADGAAPGGPDAGADAAGRAQPVIGLETVTRKDAAPAAGDPFAGDAPADDPRAAERAASFARPGPSSGTRSRRDVVSVPSEHPMLVVRVVEADLMDAAPAAGTKDPRRPIGGATVRLRIDGTEREGTTSADGTAQFAFTSPVTADVVVEAPRHALERRAAIPVSGAKRITLTVAMRAAAMTGGVVEGDGGAGISGVAVRAYRRAPWMAAIPYDDDPPPIAETRSDGHGVWRIDSLPLDEPVVVVFSGENLADRVAEVPPLPDADSWFRCDVRMARGAVHRGTVIDARGAPAAGRMVYAVPGTRERIDEWLPKHLVERLTHDESAEFWALRQIATAATGGRVSSPIRRARAGADGSFSIPGIAAEAQVVTIAFPLRSAAGRGTGSAPATAERRGSAAGLRPVATLASVQLRDPTIARLAIHGAETREQVRIAPSLPWERWAAASVGPGAAARQIALDGRVGYFFVDPDQHAPWNMIFCLDERAEATGDAGTFSVSLFNGRVITGKVCDDRGEPVGGVRVSGGGRDTITSADGTYTIRHARAPMPGQPRWDEVVEASLPGYVSERKVAGDDVANINLRRAARVRLKFELPSGASPPPWYRVWIGTRNRSAQRPAPTVPPSIDEFLSGPVPEESRWFQSRTWTGELDVLTNPQHNLLVLVAPGFCVHTYAITAPPGEETDLGTLFMARAGEMSGNVVTEDGTPIANAEVSTWAGFRPPWADALVTRTTRTDGQGGFRLPLLTPYGDPPLLVWAPGFARTVTPSAWDPVYDPAGGGAGVASPEGRFATLRRGSTLNGYVKGGAAGRQLVVRFVVGRTSMYAEVGPDGLFSAAIPVGVEAACLLDAVTGTQYQKQTRISRDQPIEFDGRD